MILSRNTMPSRLTLTYEAAQEAADARDAARFEQDAPICVYDMAAELGTTVRFVDINMEGMYERGPPAKVLLPPYRPLARRAFNCAHELGHHRFGHGSTIHELKAASEDRRPSAIPEEILAAFVLLPAIGIRRAFHRRNITPATANPLQVYTIACDFGVGYTTLVTHLSFSLEEIGETRRCELERWNPQDLRRQAVGRADPSPLIIVDEQGEALTLEVEVGHGVLTPHGSIASNDGLVLERQTLSGNLFRATRQGLTQIQTASRTIGVRIMKYQYLGLAHFRFLEDPDGDS